ncbi:hypothetical protein VNO80_09959 [Phaseolus coccineus]|uniref:Uncharacterized protein n=1 Tax=Phaseolus coccineus TaxID=3886 RepID=A0AAN9RE89_PHACN
MKNLLPCTDKGRSKRYFHPCISSSFFACERSSEREQFAFRTLNTEIFGKHTKQDLREAFISKNWPSPIYCRGQSIQPSWFDQAATIFPVHSSTTPRYSTVFTSTQNLRLFLFHQ